MKKTVIATGAFALSIWGIMAAVSGGNVTIGPVFNIARANGTQCIPLGTTLNYDNTVVAYAEGLLKIQSSPDLTTNRVSVTIINDTKCAIPVSLGTYKMFGPFNLSTQSDNEYFDGTATSVVEAGTSAVLAANIPPCASQFTIWYGDVLRVLVNNQSYGKFLAGDQLRTTDYCTKPPDSPLVASVVTSITTPVPSASVTIGGGGGPSIYITKTPSPDALPAGPGLVTYTYTVWNGMTHLDLIDVSVIDDKCGPLVFLSGDKNANTFLDPGERWTYACTSRLSVSTTNTAVAIGYSHNSAHAPATATAVATVVVGVPPVAQIPVPASTSAPAPVSPIQAPYAPTYPNAGYAPRTN